VGLGVERTGETGSENPSKIEKMTCLLDTHFLVWIVLDRRASEIVKLRNRAFDFPQTGVIAVLGIVNLGS